MSEVPPEVQALRTRTLKDLKAVLAAKAKVGIPIHLLCHEYEETTFEKLRFREMGYGTVVQLINDHPDYFITCKDPSGHIIVKGIPSKEDAHIHKLVSGQKKKSKKKKSKKIVAISVHRKTPHFTSMRNKPKPVQSFITNTINKVGKPLPQPQYGYSYSINTYSTTAFRNKPIVHQSNIPPRFQRKPPNTFFGTRSTPSFMTNQRSSSSSSTANIQSISSNLQNNSNNNTTSFQPNTSTPTISVSPAELQNLAQKLRDLLQQRPNGLYATRLKPEYRAAYNEELPNNIKTIITKHFLNFIKIESPVPPHEILYLKPDNTPQPLPSPGMTPITDMENKYQTQMNISMEQTSNPVTPKPMSNGGIKRKSGSPRCEFKIGSLALPNVGDHLNVYVCHIESLDRFFVQFEDSPIQDFVDEIHNFYQGLTPEAAEDYLITKPKVGEFCCARYSVDNTWFRAKILSVKEQKNVLNESYRCHVLYPDYGNDEYVLSTELKSLKVEFCDLPFQAMQCCLYDLYSPDGESVWSENAIEYFRKITNNVKLDLKVIEVNGMVLSVDMYDAGKESVCRHLCFSGHAKKKSTFSQSTTISPVSSPIHSENNHKTLWRSLSVEAADEVVKACWVEVPTDTDYIEVCVSYITSSNDIFVIMIGEKYHMKLEALETVLNNNFENATSEAAKDVEPGNYYVAYSDESWYRAELISFIEGGDCEVLLVDHGRKTIVAKDEIKDMPSKFLKLPFQAIRCSLEGVPETTDPEILQFMTELVLGKAYIGDILTRESSEGMTKIKIELIDTTSDDDIMINSLLSERIEAEHNLQPKLPKVGEQSCPGFIAYVSREGDFFLQIDGPGLNRLEILTNDMTGHFSQAKRASEMISRPDVGLICCAKWPETKMWYRAQVKQVFQSERKVEVEFIDYGNRETLAMVLIRTPTAVSEKVTTLPFQAVKCKLDGLEKINLDDETYNKLKDFGETQDVVYVTVVSKTSDDVPVVKLSIPVDNENIENAYDFMERFHEYLRIGDSIFEDSAIQRINDTMNTTFDNISILQSSQVPLEQKDPNNTTLSEWDVISSGNSPTKSTSTLESNNNTRPLPSSQQQPHQQLSDIREEEQKSSSGISSSNSSSSFRSNRSITPAIAYSQHWGIPELKLSHRFIAGIVQDAYDPDRFSILPHHMWQQLESLHKDMTRFYTEYTSHGLRDISSLSVGDVCVVYHTADELWYRAVIHAVVDDRMVVKFPDFNAEPEMVLNKNIRLLADQFKALPFVSIRCCLHGIEPMYGNGWTQEAAEKFHELVINETFQVEIVSDIHTMDKTKPLEVRLHGSENGEHFVVNNYLMKLGYARRKETR